MKTFRVDTLFNVPLEFTQVPVYSHTEYKPIRPIYIISEWNTKDAMGYELHRLETTDDFEREDKYTSFDSVTTTVMKRWVLFDRETWFQKHHFREIRDVGRSHKEYKSRKIFFTDLNEATEAFKKRLHALWGQKKRVYDAVFEWKSVLSTYGTKKNK
jgi:hypothetical protein